MKLLSADCLMLLALLAINACAANAPQDGVCVRSCGSRPVGGGNVKGVALNDPVKFSKCQLGEKLPQVTYRFFVYEDLSASNSGGSSSSSSSSGSSSSGSASSGTNAQFPKRIGKAGVSITPLADGNDVDTPKKDWCTDSCGFAEVSFTPTCFEQDVSVGIIAPGMIFDGEGPPKIKFSVSLQ